MPKKEWEQKQETEQRLLEKNIESLFNRLQENSALTPEQQTLNLIDLNNILTQNNNLFVTKDKQKNLQTIIEGITGVIQNNPALTAEQQQQYLKKLRGIKKKDTLSEQQLQHLRKTIPNLTKSTGLTPEQEQLREQQHLGSLKRKAELDPRLRQRLRELDTGITQTLIRKTNQKRTNTTSNKTLEEIAEQFLSTTPAPTPDQQAETPPSPEEDLLSLLHNQSPDHQPKSSPKDNSNLPQNQSTTVTANITDPPNKHYGEKENVASRFFERVDSLLKKTDPEELKNFIKKFQTERETGKNPHDSMLSTLNEPPQSPNKRPKKY